MQQTRVKVRMWKLLAAGWLLLAAIGPAMGAESSATNDVPPWLTKPLSLQDAIEIALRQNANILRSKADIEVNEGVVLQTRAILFPTVRTTGSLGARDPNYIEKFPSPSPQFVVRQPNQSSALNLQVLQSLYEGGRMRSAYRTAKLSTAQALLQYQTTVADALLEV